jgi:hypothetical protein
MNVMKKFWKTMKSGIKNKTDISDILSAMEKEIGNKTKQDDNIPSTSTSGKQSKKQQSNTKSQRTTTTTNHGIGRSGSTTK